MNCPDRLKTNFNPFTNFTLMKKLFIYLTLFGFVHEASAQEQFFTKGRIIYEKKVNILRKIEDWDAPDNYKDKIKKYQLSNWEYNFTDAKSLFKPGKQPENNSTDNMFFMFGPGANTSRMYTDFVANKRVMKKPIQSVDFILEDSIPKLEWKIQHEVRNIAGYECRKAIARFNDTVYAVAFYTDKIVPKGGPEGFTGLPGMILGLAIPRYFTTWFATKVELVPESLLDLEVPTKGDKITNEKEYKKLVDLLTRYDSYDKTLPKQTPETIRSRIFTLVL